MSTVYEEPSYRLSPHDFGVVEGALNQVQRILDREGRDEDQALTSRQRTELTEVRKELRVLLVIDTERFRRQKAAGTTE